MNLGGKKKRKDKASLLNLQPHRILGSWDAEEFGLQGSTEWVETHMPWLVSSAIAYLNIDIAVSGPRTALSGSG